MPFSVPAAVPRYIELIRVSGHAQVHRDTPEDQRAALDALRIARPGEFVARIEEGALQAISGAADFAHRPDLQRLVQLADAKAFSEVRIRRLDRLTRHPDPRERFAIFGAVMDAGAVIVDASGHTIDPKTELGEVDYFFQTLMASRERKAILERTVTARLRLAKRGQLQGRPPYGRHWNKRALIWEVTQPEFGTYQRIFREYLHGKGCIEIAKRLNDEHVPPPGSTWARSSPRWKHAPVWRHTTIHALLTHHSAVGELTSFGQQLSCPPVVDVETFEKVAERLRARNMRAGRPPATDARALLRRLAVCGRCGSRMWIVRGGSRGHWHLYYACAMARLVPLGSKCRTRHRVDAMDEKMKKFVARNLLDTRKWKAPDKDAGYDSASQLSAFSRELRRLDKQEERLVRLRMKGLASARVLDSQLGELKMERASLESKIGKAKLAKERKAEHAADKDREARLAEVRDQIQEHRDEMDFAQWRQLITTVANEVAEPCRVFPDGSIRWIERE
jgi:site-specific DNA recombinase